MDWRPWFAWFPVTTLGGRWVWFRQIDRAWDNEQNPWGYDGYSGTDGGWVYLIRLRPNAAHERQEDE